MHRLPGDDAGRLQLDSGASLRGNGTLAVDGVAKRVHDSAEQAVADGHVHDGASALHDIAFLDLSGRHKAGSGYAGWVSGRVERALTYRCRR